MEINTNNFIKFICTLSITATVFCIYFGEVYLDKYNIKSTELNTRKAQLIYESGYLVGKSHDLRLLIGDTLSDVKKIKYNSHSTGSSIPQVFYYSSINLSNDKKMLVDSLNVINRDYGKVEFEIHAIKQTHRALERNIAIEHLFSWIIGSLSFIVFLFSLNVWFKNKHQIDKQ